MKLFIKNIHQPVQTESLRSVLKEMEIDYFPEIAMGELNLVGVVTQEKLQHLKQKLGENGMEIVYDRKHIISEQVKYYVHEMLSLVERPNENYSSYLSTRLNLNYTYLANIFSETQGITIEHYTINHKIEKAKQLFMFGNYSISQVADMLFYSSIGHLSNQFKKVTGISPTDYKRQLSGLPEK